MGMGGYTAGHDPTMSRWFKQILGSGAGGGDAGECVQRLLVSALDGCCCTVNLHAHSVAGRESKASDGVSVAAAAPTTKLDARLVTPTLRTLDTLLAAGAFDDLQPPTSSWGVDVVAACRTRAQTAREDAVRVMAAGGGELPLNPHPMQQAQSPHPHPLSPI